MGISVQPRSGKFQLRVTHKLLPRPFFHTFAEEAAARTYGEQLRKLLERGVVPEDLVQKPAQPGARPGRRDDPLLLEMIRDYTRRGPLTESDDQLLTTITNELARPGAPAPRASHITSEWADALVADLKAQQRTPGTIRKRIGVLGRVFAWYARKHKEMVIVNPFDHMPIGYSAYGHDDDEAVFDEERSRRLEAGEEAKILAVLAGEKRPDRERAWGPDEEFEDLYRTIVGTGVRLRESYKLQVAGLDAANRLLHVDGSKGARGARKPRTVPLTTELTQRLVRRIGDRKAGPIFSYWDGDADKKKLRQVTVRLSKRFESLFRYAGVDDLTEHDLRHEATCRWVTLRHPSGGWLFSETEICKIMGWSDPRMMLRYASLRGTDLSSRLA